MANASPAFFGPTSLFIPSFTGEIVGYIREPGQFAVTEYCQLVKSTAEDGQGKPICTYFILDPDEPVRLPSINDFYWPAGNRSPEAKIVINGAFRTVIMDRAAYPYEYSGQEEASADIKVGAIYREMAASIAMTAKTQRVQTIMQTAANWGNSTSDANTLNGGFGNWANASSDEQSPNFAAIAKSLTAAMQKINLNTNSVVKPKDLMLVISPGLANKMANSGEMRGYLKSSPFAKEVQEGRNDFSSLWGLPKVYTGLKLIVEDASLVNERANISGTSATTNRKYIWNDQSAAIVSRIGGINGVYGSKSLSTMQIFYYRFEMSVMEEKSSWHDLCRGKVVDQYKEVLVSAPSGYLITATA